MVGPIERFMIEDHVRIDALFAAATRDGMIGELAYGRFRRELLRHIAMEERILLPFAREKRGGEPLPCAAALRTDHGAIARLLVRSPSIGNANALTELLGRHHALEEGPDGLYASCDALAGADVESVLGRLRAQPKVKLTRSYDGPLHHRS